MRPIATNGLVLLCVALRAASQDQAPQPPAGPPPAPQTSAPKPQVGQSTYEDIESIFSVSLFYWKPSDGDARLAGGRLSPDPPAQTIDLVGKPKDTPGIILTFPTGRSNRLELSFWEARSSGSTTPTIAHTSFGQSFDRNEFLTTENRVRSVKISWNYLSYPYPPLDSKFRLKTLWEIQYVQARPVITAPFTAEPAQGDTPALPALRAMASRKVILPTVGLGVEYIPSIKHFRVEAKGSAMAFPGKSQIWDTEASAVARAGNFELYVGAKRFHFRTSPGSDQYVEGNLWGPFAGVRWVFR